MGVLGASERHRRVTPPQAGSTVPAEPSQRGRRVTLRLPRPSAGGPSSSESRRVIRPERQSPAWSDRRTCSCSPGSRQHRRHAGPYWHHPTGLRRSRRRGCHAHGPGRPGRASRPGSGPASPRDPGAVGLRRCRAALAGTCKRRTPTRCPARRDDRSPARSPRDSSFVVYVTRRVVDRVRRTFSGKHIAHDRFLLDA